VGVGAAFDRQGVADLLVVEQPLKLPTPTTTRLLAVLKPALRSDAVTFSRRPVCELGRWRPLPISLTTARWSPSPILRISPIDSFLVPLRRSASRCMALPMPLPLALTRTPRSLIRLIWSATSRMRWAPRSISST
jgi:hypothetical protein